MESLLGVIITGEEEMKYSKGEMNIVVTCEDCGCSLDSLTEYVAQEDRGEDDGYRLCWVQVCSCKERGSEGNIKDLERQIKELREEVKVMKSIQKCPCPCPREWIPYEPPYVPYTDGGASWSKDDD